MMMLEGEGGAKQEFLVAEHSVPFQVRLNI
jgi:hypothetical protein